jgi:DNA invertase Pin-like site-specific DNA recombinase
MLIGYMRISKGDGSQVLDLQIDALVAAGVDKDRIYQDTVSSRKEDRPGLRECLKALQPGNTLVVWKLDRLGRDLKNLVAIVDDLCKRNIGFKILSSHGANIDTTTPHGKLMFGVFASLAEYERDLIVERTYAGLRAARARGRFGGRPRKMDAATLKIAVAAMSNRESIAAEVAKKLGLTTATLYAYVNGDGSLKPAGEKLLNNDKKEKQNG